MFDTVLIANRGEIAVRVARTCREMGVRTVAVYSTADRDSAVTRIADSAVHIGPAPARRSYLNVPAVIEAARQSGADAIHPGYGFLSEDPDFAEVCEAHGIVFIGPPPGVMATMGDKALARAVLSRAGLPVLPGSEASVDDVSTARDLADGIGYPVIIKAVAGGGGRGVRVVSEPGDLPQAYHESRASAQALFADSRVYLERYLQSARHVEVQVLCDRYGNAVHLGERDCSVQRRHQKLIEESPAPGLSADLIDRMRAAAVRGALAVGYEGVGTFEFLVGGDDDFYLMEVNCRIQVEHPVTEMVTGIDLVRQQLLVASGEPLDLQQSDVVVRGVAVECRVNAEDPDRDFLPTAGTLTEFEPSGGPFVRVDTHAYRGYRVPLEYDSLLAKAVVWAPDRDEALARMARVLAEFRVAGPGVCTSIGFLRTAIEHPLFRGAKHDTSFTETFLS
ncbi:acetyl-CoA carboxylase biotin carboxylase subunit [Jidongwangia harbinensis]|uniref:acetyl-CoA carboxylase biotin carboxylase subunit n=1 Tax=Jidongwangia harbinensis TaxID=2878561 RepID=UPI001CD9CC70|nr:acetyl-CoA carboxylase biotin carboxylase subunit [Jidongwangia harbinensis]MCA2219215.1 acetyl-CoA carboxylase biotin carboxylase subunit [Jidongwangia harbinensis]